MKVSTLDKDKVWDDVESGKTVWARNVVYSEKYGSISNEDGFSLLLSNGKIITGVIDTNKEDVLFLGEGGTSEIGVYVNGVYSKRLASALLDFHRDVPVDGIHFYNSAGELNVIWWDGNFDKSKKPRILNLDCLPFDVDVNKVPISSADMILLDLHQNNPSLNLDIEIRDSGRIEAGAYYVVFAYILPDGSYTNYSHPSSPIYITDDSSKLEFQEIDGTDGVNLVNKSILLKFTGLNVAYPSINVVLIKKVGGVQSAIEVGDIDISVGGGANIVYNNFAGSAVSSLESVLIDSPIYIRNQTGVILDSQLHMMNLSIAEKPKIQQYVNNIDVEWVLEEGGNLCDFENSNKDGEYTFFNKGFKSGETYALYLVCKVKDLGLIAYHIPVKGRDMLDVVINAVSFSPDTLLTLVQSTIGGPGMNVNVDEGLLVNNGAKVFHIFNTAQSDGRMGVFINKDEQYENKECWLVYDVDGNEIGDLRGHKTTHHTFPSWQRLLEFNIANNLYDVNDVAKLTLLASTIADSQTDGSFPSGSLIKFATKTNVTGTWNVDGNEFTATEDMNIYLRILFMLVDAPSDTDPKLNVAIYKEVSGEIAERYFFMNYDGAIITTDELHFEIKLNVGEKLHFNFFSSPDTLEGRIEVLLINKKLDECDITGKKLGIKLSNVNIPLEFQDVIEEWYLGFAERTNVNITRSGQGIMIPDTIRILNIYPPYDPLIDPTPSVVAYGHNGYSQISTPAYRVHNFDHLYFKSNINVDFITGNIKVGTSGTYDFHNLITPFADSGRIIKSVKESYLVPEGLISENNRIGEEHLKIKLNNATNFGIVGKYQFLQADLAHFKENVYLNFENQNVILINKAFPVTETLSDNLYQGDIFLVLQGFATGYLGDRLVPNTLFYLLGSGSKFGVSNKEMDNFLYVSESISNLGFRYKDDNDDNRYYPRYISLQTNPLFKFTEAEIIAHVTGKESPGLLYNEDFNALNNIKSITVFLCLEDCLQDITRFPVRIHKGPNINDESLINSWRRFRINDYYDGLPKDKGEGWVLRVLNRSLIIQLNEALFVANPKDIIKSDAIFAYLGSGDLFDRLPDEIVPDGSGYVGCISKWSAGVTKHGYHVWDSKQGKVFIFDGKITEISNEGLREHLMLLSDYSNTLYTDDNPLCKNGLTVGYDEKYNRLLITKILRDETFVIDSVISKTLSYSFDFKGWTCTDHDYFPSIYLYNRRGLFSVNNKINLGSSRLYKHNVDDVFCLFYDSIRYAAYFDVIFNDDRVDKLWESVQWLSTVFSSNGVVFEDTISSICIYTNHHLTGEIVLDKHNGLTSKNDNVRRKNYIWSFNKLRDVILNRNVEPVSDEGVINIANINNNLPFFKKNYIINPFIIVRFKIADTVINKIHISDVFAEYTKDGKA